MAHKEKTIPIIVYLDEKTKEEISALAKKTRRSRTMEIRLAIEAHLQCEASKTTGQDKNFS